MATKVEKASASLTKAKASTDAANHTKVASLTRARATGSKARASTNHLSTLTTRVSITQSTTRGLMAWLPEPMTHFLETWTEAPIRQLPHHMRFLQFLLHHSHGRTSSTLALAAAVIFHPTLRYTSRVHASRE